MDVAWKVTVDGQVMEDCTDDVTSVTSLDVLVQELQKRWGTYSDIDIHVWRENWSA